MPTIAWQIAYDHQEPRSCEEDDKERILYLRDMLEIDHDSHYTLEELEEMNDNADLRDHEG